MKNAGARGYIADFVIKGNLAPSYHRAAAKRVLDILAVLIALPLLAPLMLLIALAIRLETAGPVLFRQRRGGRDGRPFHILKFRTLNVIEDGTIIPQICRSDCRTTLVGGFLRRTSLDELPQLINVLRGEMSIVGPRPHALAHDEYYERELPGYRRRFAVRPGITGWAQVNGARGPTPELADMQRRVDLDVWYIENQSLRLDLRIIVKTVVGTLTGRIDAF